MAEATSGTGEGAKVPWDLHYWGKRRLESQLDRDTLLSLCVERKLKVENSADECVHALLAWKAVGSAAAAAEDAVLSSKGEVEVRRDLLWWTEARLERLGDPRLLSLCKERNIKIQSPETPVSALLKWKEENRKKTVEPKKAAAASGTGVCKKTNDVEVPWNLEDWTAEKLIAEISDLRLLREMCAVRGIEIKKQAHGNTCITALMKWKTECESPASQTQAEPQAKKKAKKDPNARWKPKLGWPNAHDQASSYCGNMPGLISHYEEKNLSTSGGMKPSHVKNWLSEDPENRVPDWLKPLWNDDPKKVSADHIIPDKLGGHPWPHNYFLMPRDDNSHFSASVEKEKKKYVGAAYETASSFARWVRDAARARIDYSRFDPVDARFIGRA